MDDDAITVNANVCTIQPDYADLILAVVCLIGNVAAEMTNYPDGWRHGIPGSQTQFRLTPVLSDVTQTRIMAAWLTPEV